MKNQAEATKKSEVITIETLEKEQFKNINFKNEELKEAVKIMLDNNMIVLFNKNKYGLDDRISYVSFSEGDNIGYAQCGDFGHGVRFSTVHKGNKNCGTGFGLQDQFESIDNPTIEDIKHTFIFAPNWAKQRDVEKVVKYKGFNDYFKSPVNRILTYTILTK